MPKMLALVKRVKVNLLWNAKQYYKVYLYCIHNTPLIFFWSQTLYELREMYYIINILNTYVTLHIPWPFIGKSIPDLNTNIFHHVFNNMWAFSNMWVSS